MVDKFCCSAAADVSKCKGDDKWKYAGMVVKDKVCIAAHDILGKFKPFSSKVFAEVPITGIVKTSGVNETIAFKRAAGDHRKNSTQQLTLTIQYTGEKIQIKMCAIVDIFILRSVVQQNS